MKIEVSELTIKIIICSLKTYLNKCLDIDEDAAEMIVVAKALGELQGAFNALKDSENRETRWKFRNISNFFRTWRINMAIPRLK